MNRISSYSTLFCVLASGAFAAEAEKPTSETRIARGSHIVNQIAMCSDCHTPRLPTGQLDETKLFQGAPLGFAPSVPMPWNPVAPSIAGLPGYTDEQAVTFLTTGKKPNGQLAMPPMPGFRLTDEEAHDVVAYLKSLKTPSAD